MLDTEHPEETISSAWDGRPRRLAAHACDQCRARFFAPRHTNSQFCSKLCAATAKRKQVPHICGQCGCKFNRTPNRTLANARHGVAFCSRACKDVAQRLEGVRAIHPPHYGNGGVCRDRLLRERGRQCQRCNLTEWLGLPIDVEVDHIDGNAFNNDPANLRILCHNCHAQTPTWRGRNRGRGRKSRMGP